MIASRTAHEFVESDLRKAEEVLLREEERIGKVLTQQDSLRAYLEHVERHGSSGGKEPPEEARALLENLERRQAELVKQQEMKRQEVLALRVRLAELSEDVAEAEIEYIRNSADRG
jgi:hypothetical protein